MEERQALEEIVRQKVAHERGQLYKEIEKADVQTIVSYSRWVI